jgi:adenylylsulfate kinase
MSNIVWHHHKVTKKRRSERLRQSPGILWFTGLSGAGKSTLAGDLEEKLFSMGYQVYLLDGDNVRHGLCKDLGFSDKDRIENIRRVGEVSKLMLDAGMIILAAFISPFKQDRQMVRQLVEEHEFIEIHVSAPLAICEERDPKGLYKKARQGEIKNFTGIDSVYELPENPELVIETHLQPFEKSVEQVLGYLMERGILNK